MAGSIELADYTSQSSITQDWLENIAPKYFDFDQTNNLRTGLFGYINEVMGNTVEDTFNAVTIARREFYPTQAQYVNSIYRMGALQELDAPMSVPAVVNAVLVIKEEQIIPYLESDASSYTISDKTVFAADDIPFMLDYPIIITGSKPGSMKSHLKALERDSMAYTIRYDRSVYNNSLNTDHRIYLKNKVVSEKGVRYILIQCLLRQVQVTSTTYQINKNAFIETVTQDVSIDGKIANFEVFYKEAGSDAEYQLKKILVDSDTPTEKFVEYQLVDENTLRLHFPENNYFTPAFNSQIRVVLYTTLGSDGNFTSFTGNLSCSVPESATFRTRRSIIIDGTTMGSAYGGIDRDELEQFRKNVKYAYATNKTICTDNDLQLYWDKINDDTNNKVLFFKQRDDVFQRLYGAYMLLRDDDKNVIPTNTLTILMNQGTINTDGSVSSDTDFDAYYESSDRFIIRPGAMFRYIDDESSGSYLVRRDKDISLDRDNSNYEEVCDYIQKAITKMYDNDTTRPVIQESTYSFIIKNKSITQVQDDITQFLYDYYGYQLPSGKTLDYYASFSGPKEFDTYSDALVFIASDTSAYTGEYITIKENRLTYQLDEDYNLVPVGELSALTRVRLSYFLFTNPYMISIMRKPNAVAYYQNSVDATYPLDYDRIAAGTESSVQFIANNLHISRNAILGENFYKLSMTISPSTPMDGFADMVVEKRDEEDENNIIRAPYEGYVASFRYEEAKRGRRVMTAKWVEETDEAPGVFATVMMNMGTYYQPFKIRISSTATTSEEGFGENIYYFGYDIKFEPSKFFKRDAIIATRKDRDLSRIKMILMINPDGNGYSTTYVPFVMENYDPDTEWYTFCAYMATDDEITVNETFHITHGMKQVKSGKDQDGKIFYYDTDVPSKSSYINTSNTLDMRIAVFLKYDDTNNPDYWASNTFINGKNFDPDYPITSSKHFLDLYGEGNISDTEKVKNNSHTFTNEYKVNFDTGLSNITEDQKKKYSFKFMHSVEYIRSVLTVDYEADGTGVDADVEAQYESFQRIKSKFVRTFNVQREKIMNQNLTEEERDEKEDALYNQLVYDLNEDQSYRYKDETYTLNGIIQYLKETIDMSTGGTTTFTIKSVPMVKAEWIKSPSNASMVMKSVESNYQFVDQAYTYLENNFSIDMKFYNTYGRSRFYIAGLGNIKDNMQILDRTNCSFNFGVKIDQTTPIETFTTRFKEFVRSYIESLNNIEAEGKPLYIMDLVASIKNNFAEISYLEYYGMNSYDHTVQKVVSNFDVAMANLRYNEYVPEFINANGINHDFEIEPAVNITFLDE